MYVDINGKSFADWFKRNIIDPFKEEWNHVFGNGQGGWEIGYNSSGGFFTNPTYNGNSWGPSGGISNSGKITTGNSQGGFHNMHNANFNSELEKTVALAELKAYEKYWENTRNWTNYIDNFNSTPDIINLNISANAAGGLGFGFSPINFTIITIGDDAGLYYSPTVNASFSKGTEYNANAVFNFSVGHYTGNKDDFKSYYLVGNNWTVSFNGGDGVYGGVNGGWTNTPNGKLVIYGGGSIGGGYGVPSISGNYQYTPAMVLIFKFKNALNLFKDR